MKAKNLYNWDPLDYLDIKEKLLEHRREDLEAVAAETGDWHGRLITHVCYDREDGSILASTVTADTVIKRKKSVAVVGTDHKMSADEIAEMLGNKLTTLEIVCAP